MLFSDLAHVNAILNSITTIFLLSGFVAIRKKKKELHKKLMIAAFVMSLLFLISYLTYHFQVGSVKYQGVGWIRKIYFTILITHTILASVVPFLVITTLWLTGDTRGCPPFEKHKKLARWTLPIWIYVSITGVVIYVMLYL